MRDGFYKFSEVMNMPKYLVIERYDAGLITDYQIECYFSDYTEVDAPQLRNSFDR